MQRSVNFAGGWPGSRSTRRTKILVDRCLTPTLARALKTFGFQVLTLGEIYGNDGQHIYDTTWIADAGANDYVVFTANPAMYFVPHERAAILAAGTKIFSISNPQQSREGRALIFGRHMLQIIRRARKPGPCFWRLTPGRNVQRDIP